MKKLTFLTLFVLLADTVIAEESRQVSHTLTLSHPDKAASIDISLFDGSINIVGHKSKEIIIEAKIERLAKVNVVDSGKYSDWGDYEQKDKESPKSDAKTDRSKGLKRVTNTAIHLEIEENKNKVEIETMNRNQRVDLMVKVPFNSNLDVQLHRGDDIKIEKVYGSIEVMNARGSITALAIKGPIVAECARNDLVVVFEEFSTTKPSSLISHRGNVDVSLPTSSKVSIEVKNFQGEIYSGLAVDFKNTDSFKKRGDSHGQQITIGDAMVAKLNAGTQKLMLNTYRGDIFVRENRQ